MDQENADRVESLFLAVLPLERPEQDEELERLCPADPALAEHVRELLREHSSAVRHGFLEPGTIAQRPDGPRMSLTEGSRIGPYEITRRIGTGGMGIVYEARAHRALSATSRASRFWLRMDEDLLRRFRNERQYLASLEHPNIVRLLDGGETDSGCPTW